MTVTTMPAPTVTLSLAGREVRVFGNRLLLLLSRACEELSHGVLRWDDWTDERDREVRSLRAVLADLDTLQTAEAAGEPAELSGPAEWFRTLAMEEVTGLREELADVVAGGRGDDDPQAMDRVLADLAAIGSILDRMGWAPDGEPDPDAAAMVRALVAKARLS